MAEEGKPDAIGAAIDTVIGNISHLVEPDEKSTWYKLRNETFSMSYWVDYLADWYVSRGLLVSIFFIAGYAVAQATFAPFSELVAGWIALAFPILGVAAGYKGFQAAWMWYAQSYYIYTRTNPVLLEVHMPHHVEKTPRAMEQVLTSFWIRSGTTTFIDRGYYGGVLPYTSLEICSFGGEVHFFIWCRSTYRNVLEAAMYAQYPEVEIEEVEDYASKFEFDPDKHHCWATDYRYTNPDVYPIKTYHDFEIDEEIEEFSVDPYGSVLEVLSSMNHEEQAWIQIVIRGNFKKPSDEDSWQSEIHHEVERIREEASQQIAVDPETGEQITKLSFPRPTQLQNDQMHALERHMGKLAFDVGLRGMYIAPAGKMRSAEFTAFRWIWRPFNNQAYLNALRPSWASNDFDYLYQDWGRGPDGIRWKLVIRRYFDAYRRRQFFHPPWTWPKMRMTVETIATLWHPPSGQVKTPGLHRLHVGKSEAPHNLPM